MASYARPRSVADPETPKSVNESNTDVSVPTGVNGKISQRIWMEFGGPNYHRYKSQMRVCPYISFKQPEVETAYATSMLPSYTFRIPFCAGVLSLVQLYAWLLVGILMEKGTLAIQVHGFVIAYQLISALAFAMLAFLSCINAFPKFTPRLESMFYLLTVPYYLLIAIWIVVAYIHGQLNVDRLITEGKQTVMKAIQTKFWSDTLILVTLFTLLTIYDQFMTLRTSVVLFLHLAFLSMWSLSNGIAIWALRSPFAHEVYPAVTLTQIMLIINGIILVSEAYLGRWQKEFIERVAYLDIRADQVRLKDLRDAQKKRKKAKGETVGEAMIFQIKKAQTAVQTAAFERSAQGDARLLELDEIMRQVIELLLDTDDLFAVGAVKDAQEGEEAESRFINMFQTTHTQGRQQRTSKKKTGDDYLRHTFDQQEFFSSDILPTFNIRADFKDQIGKSTSIKLLEVFKTTPLILVETGLCLLGEYKGFLSIPDTVITKYLYQVNRRYFPNPYHNACHGAMVAHMAVCISSLLGVVPKVSEIDRVSLILAGLTHDMGHPGRNNNYYLNACGFLAKLYNDSSILEMYHCFLAFRYAQIGAEVNVFQGLPPEVFSQIRQNMIDFILVTDMAQHFASISKFRVRRASEKFDIAKNPDDATLVMKCCMKMADLSHALVDWAQHLDWSMRVCSEFYQQGEEEQRIGLPVSPLCDPATHSEWCKSQAGFLQFVVIPLANELAEIDETGAFGGELVTKVLFNKHKWEMLKEKGEMIPLTPEIRECEIAPTYFAESTCALALKAKTVDEINTDPLQATDIKALVDHNEAVKTMLKEEKAKPPPSSSSEEEEEEDEEDEEESEDDDEPILSPRRATSMPDPEENGDSGDEESGAESDIVSPRSKRQSIFAED